MIPEPTTILWPWLRKAIDTTFPIWVDEAAAFRLRDMWQSAAAELDRTVGDATAANGQLPSAWLDPRGIAYNQRIDRMLNSPATGTAELIESMRSLSALSDEYGRNIVWVKDQIYAELAANGIAFAATFGLPGPVGDFFRGRILTGMVGRIAAKVAAAAARVAAAGRNVRAVTPRLVRDVANEMIEEPLITIGSHKIDQWRGQRAGVDWNEVGIASQAGGLGAIISRPLAPIGFVVSLPARAAFRRAPDWARNIAVNGSSGFVVNGISSPVSGTFVQAIANGNNPWQQDYLTAIAEQGLGAGALGTMRIGAHELGHALGNHGTPPSTVETETKTVTDIGPDGPDDPPPNVVAKPDPAGQVAAQPTEQPAGGLSDQLSGAPAGQAANTQATADQLGTTNNGQTAGSQQVGDGSDSRQEVSGRPLVGAANVSVAAAQAPPIANGAAPVATATHGPPASAPAAPTGAPAATAQQSVAQQSAAQQSAAQQSVAQAPAAQPGAAAQQSGLAQQSGTAQSSAQPAVQQPAAGQGSSQAGGGQGQGATQTPQRPSGQPTKLSPESNDESNDDDAARADALARGEAFLELQTADFVPDVDGFQGRDSVVPPELMTTGPSGPTLVGAAAQAAPTAVPLSANAAHRGPNRGESGSAGPVHTRSSRSEQDESGKPESETGPVDNDPPVPTDPPASPAPAGEPEPGPRVVVNADAVAAAGGSVQLAAQQELVARMNDRGPAGELTPEAKRLRSEFYRTGAGRKPSTGVLARRPLDADTPATERTFTAEVGSERVRIPLPWVSQDKSAVLSLAAVHDGEKVGTTKVAFDDPVLQVSDVTMEHLQRIVNAWSRSFGKPEVPIPEPAAGDSAEQAGSVPELGRGQLGEEFARPFDRWLAARHPGDRIFRVSLQLDGAGSFDQVYVRLDADGTIVGFAIVEAKNPNADLNTRLGVDGETRYAQGHREYVRSILEAMTVLDRNEQAAVLDSMHLVEVALSAEEYADAQATYHATQRARAADSAQVAYAEAAAKAAEQELMKQARADVKPAKEAARAAGADAEAAQRAGEQALERHRPAWKAAYAAAFQSAFADFAADPEAAYQTEYEAAYRAAHRAYVEGGGLPHWLAPARPLTSPEIRSSFDLAEAMSRFLSDGTLEYFTVRAEVDGSTGLDRPKGIAITEYSMGLDTGATRHHGWAVEETRFVPYGRPLLDRLSKEEALAAAGQTVESDFGGLIEGRPTVSGEFLVVQVPGSDTPLYFKVQIGHVRPGRIAATDMQAGTKRFPHIVTIPPGVANDQLARVWVHELSHTVQELNAPEAGPVRRFWNKLTGGGPNPCLDAQFNEFRYLRRQWSMAAAEAARTGAEPDIELEADLRKDITGLADAIRARGHTPPVPPWTAPSTATPHGELVARLAAGFDLAHLVHLGAGPREYRPGGRTPFLPWGLMLNLELPTVIQRADVLEAAEIDEVAGDHGEYRVTNGNGTFRLFIRVRPLPAGTVYEPFTVPGKSPTAWVTVSDQVPSTELPRLVARILAETAASTLDPSDAQLDGSAEKPVFTPGSNPWADARLEDTDRGDLADATFLAEQHAKAEQLAESWIRRRGLRRAMADLFVRMSLTKEQPNADLLRTLVPEKVRDLVDRVQDRRSLKDNRLRERSYLVKAVATSVWSSALVFAAAWQQTNSLTVAIGMAVPTAVFGLASAPAERWLDEHKSAHKKPAYGADQEERNRRFPGLRGTLDGQQPTPPPVGKVQRTTGRPRFLVRYAIPLAAAGVTAGALALAGIPALSTLYILTATAAVRTLTERWVEATKRSQRRARVGSNVLRQIANPDSGQNQLITVLQEQQEQLNKLRNLLRQAAGLPPVEDRRIKSPRKPKEHEIESRGLPLRVHLGQQVYDNDVAAGARTLNPRLPAHDIDLTEISRELDRWMEAFVAAVGPAAGGAVLGAFGDKLFVTVEERLHDLQKNWDYAHRESIRGQALIDALAEPLQRLDEAFQELLLLAGAEHGPDLADRVADRRTQLTTPEALPGPRPSRKVRFAFYAIQVFLAAAGTAGTVLVLDGFLGLYPLTVWTTVAGAIGAFTGAPIARMLFRHAELERKDANAEALNKQGVDRAELTEQVAFGKYLVAQLLDQIYQLREDLQRAGQPPVVVSPTDADYTDRVRAAVEVAHRDDVVGGPNPTAEELAVREQRVAVLTWIDRVAADVDWADAADPGSAESARQRARLAREISRYEAIEDADGTTMAFPDLASVSPERGRRVTGGPMDQIRAGAARALGRMLGEPGDKPFLADRLAALQAIVEAADAIDVHAEYATTKVGSEESHAYLFEQLAERIKSYQEVLVKANIVGGFPLPAVSPDGGKDNRADQDTGPDQDGRSEIARVLNPEVHADEVVDTRFVSDGRTGPALTTAEAVDAVRRTSEADFGGLVSADPTTITVTRRDGHEVELVMVITPAGRQYFEVTIGAVPAGRMARTQPDRGTSRRPHRVTFPPGIANDQLARLWVHEISHTLQELNARRRTPVRRLLTRLTGGGHDACVDAQFNEFRFLRRRLSIAEARGDHAEQDELRKDMEGLAEAISDRGYPPPALPSPASSGFTSQAELKGAIAVRLQGLTDAAKTLNALMDAKNELGKTAAKAQQEAKEKATKARNAKDNAKHARLRAAEADEKKQADLAHWYHQLVTNYRQTLAMATAAQDGYRQLLADMDTSTPDQVAAEATRLADAVAAYEQSLNELAPPPDVLAAMMPTGRLPLLAALAERINAVLKDQGIDESFTARRLQQRLTAEFAGAVSPEGAVLRVGRRKTADLRIRLTVGELVEVVDPPTKHSETMNGLFAQPARKLATTSTGRFGTSFTMPGTTLLRLIGDVTGHSWVGDLTVKREYGVGWSRALTANAAEFAQYGAVEDNRGEGLLFSGKASWQIDVRTDRSTGWSPAEKVASSNNEAGGELRAWASHAYTVKPATDLAVRPDLRNGRLPAHIPISISGLEGLTDHVIDQNADRLEELGGDRLQVEDQIHAALTKVLPARISESTEQVVVAPLMAGGKPVGHLEVTTEIQYETVERVGARSTAHWQESVRVGFSNAGVVQNFGANASETTTVGYKGAAVTDIDESGTDAGPSASAGQSVSRSESLSGGGTAIHVGVHRFTGPTQGYRMVLKHNVKLVLNGTAKPAVPGESQLLARVRVNDAYRHGLPVDREAVLDAANDVVEGDIDPNAVVPGRKLEVPNWAVGNDGLLNVAGPWNVQAVTGGREALRKAIAHFADRGFVPPLDADGKPDLTKLSADPVERLGQLRNLEELRAQLSSERLEAGYDIAARTGIVVTLTRPRTAEATETVSLRIGIEQGDVTAAGVTTDEAVVWLNIGSETAGRSGARTKAKPWRLAPFGLRSGQGPDDQGMASKLGLSYGRQSLGRMLAWFTGGTINQVTLVESTSPVAVFRVAHTLTVTEVGETDPFHRGDNESARVLLDSDFLPYADPGLGGPSSPAPGPVPTKVLERATLLAVGELDPADQLPEAIKTEPTARQQIAAFLNPRNLLAHPEWASTTYRTRALLPGPVGITRKVPVALTGEIRDATLVSVADGVAGDINFALGNHGTASGRSGSGSLEASAGAAVNSVGGGYKASLGSGTSENHTDQTIWGVERLTIETGRHYVFEAAVDFELAVGDAVPVPRTSTAVFQVAERDVLRFYGRGELALPLHQVADAVERYLHRDLSLDRRTAVGLIRRYRADLAAAPAKGVPVLASGHTAQVLAARLQSGPQRSQQSAEERLETLLLRAEAVQQVELPAHYKKHLGSSLVESVDLTSTRSEGQPALSRPDIDVLSEVQDVLRNELGVDFEQDPVIAESLFADLAGKRWWGRLEDMLGPTGFVRTYPVSRSVGELTARQVSVRIRAEFTGEADNQGEVEDVVSIVQRYLYEEHIRTWDHGRSSGLGADGTFGAGTPADENEVTPFDPGRSGSVGTDQSQGLSTTEAEQLTRLERIATFDGVARVSRGLRLTIEVSQTNAAPTRGAIARGIAPEGTVTSAPPRVLEGTFVQLIPSKLLPVQPAGGGRVVVPNDGPPLELPATYVVEGVGSGPRDLLEVVNEWLAGKDLLGRAGVRMHQAVLENKLSASARNATFSRMASKEGFGLDPLDVPGYTQQTVHTAVRARVTEVELVAGPFKGELGDVNRALHTVSTSSTSGRLLPVAGSETLTATEDVAGTLGGGEQLTDSTTDVRGSRRERSRFEEGDLVTVRVGVAYDLSFTRTRIRPDGSERVVKRPTVPAAATGEAYLTLHAHDYHALIAAGRQVVRSPEIEGTRYVAEGRPAEGEGLSPGVVLLSAALTHESDYGGLITGRPDPQSGRAVVVEQGNLRQYFGVRIGDVDSGMAFTELHAGTEDDPHVTTFAPGVPIDQLPRVWVHEISHTLQELAASGEGPLQRLSGALTTDGQNACVDAQYNEFRFLVRRWYENVTRGLWGSEDELRRDAEGLARAIEARGYPPPAIPWLTAAEEDQVNLARYAQVMPPIPPRRAPGSPPRVILLDGSPGADLSTTQARLLSALEFDGWASYDGDDNRSVHPRFEQLMREWGTAGQELILKALPPGLALCTLNHLLEADPPCDIVVRHPVGRLQNTEIQVATFQPHGYRVSIAYIATNESNSLLGSADSYQRARDGDDRGGCWYGREWHDLVYAELPDTVHTLEAAGMVDDIYILTPDGDVLYENHQDADGNWDREFAARETLLAERDRPPTPPERERFQQTADRLLDGRTGLPPLDDVVEQTVLDAISRELARPEARPDHRDFGEDDKIDNRLGRSD